MGYYKFKLPKTGSMVAGITVCTEFKENWQYFFNEPTMTPEAPGEVSKVVDVKMSVVRRGPGDPNPFTRKDTNRFYVRFPKSKGSARPGKTYRVGELNPLGSGYRELRQFSIIGTDMDIFAYAIAKAKFELVLWSPWGSHETIPGASAGGTLGQNMLKLVTPTP
jgi:hypothetical protein